MAMGLIDVKLKRHYGFLEVLDRTFCVESFLKVGAANRIILSNSFFVRKSSRLSTTEHILVLNIFNMFMQKGVKENLFDFEVPRMRKPGSSLSHVFEIFNRVNLKGFRLSNFMYMLLAVHLPRVVGVSERSTTFSSSIVLPDFGVYPEKLDEYVELYPQYGPILKKVGFLRALPQGGMLAMIPFSSYMFKHTYVSSLFDSEWSARIEFYCLSNRVDVEFEKLFCSFFKFYSL